MKTPLYFQICVKNQKDPFFKNPKTPLKKGWDDTMCFRMEINKKWGPRGQKMDFSQKCQNETLSIF